MVMGMGTLWRKKHIIMGKYLDQKSRMHSSRTILVVVGWFYSGSRRSGAVYPNQPHVSTLLLGFVFFFVLTKQMLIHLEVRV